MPEAAVRGDGLNHGLRIGISTTVLDRNDGKRPMDGIGVYTRSLIREFRGQQALDVRGYAYRPVANPAIYRSLSASFREMALRAMLPFAKRVDIPVDVFHVTDFMGVPMSCPVVSTLYDAIPFVNPAMANSRFRRLKNFLLRRSAQYADHIIAISNYATDEIVTHYGVPRSKITVIHCGIESDWLNVPSQPDVDRVLKIRHIDPGYFLTVGTIQPRKNLKRMINAHSMLSENIRKRHPLVVVGKVGWSCEDELLSLREKISCGEARWFADVQSQKELKCFYAGAQGFLFPSLYEGFGLPVLEAFASGVPVLTSNTTSLPEVSGGIGIEVDPTNLNELVEGMQYLLEMSDTDPRITAGRARAAALSWRRCAEQTLQVYRRLL